MLGDDRIVTRSGGYALDVPPDAVDAHRFDRLAHAGRDALQDGNPAEAADVLRGALALWRGAPLADFAEDQFARPVITGSRSAARHVGGPRRGRPQLGRDAELIGELEAAVQGHPLRERLWTQLMTALYRAGRQSDALACVPTGAPRSSPRSSASIRDRSSAIWSWRSSSRTPRSARRDAAARRRVARPTNLPVAGRRADRAPHGDRRDHALLERHRVVTIVGPGGVGKTRLAAEVGRRRVEQHPDGVWLADLASVGDVADVAATSRPRSASRPSTARALAATALDRLRRVPLAARLLLVLDNCEHVVAEVARIVADLIAHGGELQCSRRVVSRSPSPVRRSGR